MSAPTYLHYRLRLRSPAIVSTLSGDPDSAATQPFIPGSALRGVVAARLIANGVSEDGEEFRRMVLSGQVRYLHAYPEIQGARSVPTPSAWRRKKLKENEGFDLAAWSGNFGTSEADGFEAHWPDEDLVAVSEPFAAASPSSGQHEIGGPAIGSRLHQQRDRIKGRPWKDRAEERHGALFAYEYLEPDQIFCGVIQVMPAAAGDVEHIKRLLASGPVLIGRSRRAGYGGEAEIEFTETTDREYLNVSGSISGDVTAGASFRIFLTSAYIGRDPVTGQMDPTALQQEIEKRLGKAATVERTRWTFETVGAFNKKWRLEVPQAQAVAAGAVLVLKAAAAIPAITLRAIEHEGIGERRLEGFGRLLFLEHFEEEHPDDSSPIRLGRWEREDGADSHGPDVLAERHRRELQLLERRIVLAAARAELERVAAIDLVGQTRNRPTNSLIGRLRMLLRGALDEVAARAGLATLRTWCGEDDKAGALRQNAREKLDRCKVRGSGLRDWLRRLAEGGEGRSGWEALLEACGRPDTLTSLAARNYLTEPSAAEAVLYEQSALLRAHLIDSFLAALARLNRGGGK